jgi:selenocysteine lyase/cysteine desulfurase
VCATYKWLMGPYSMGLPTWAALRCRRALEETWIGRAGSENFKDLVNYRDDYQPGAVRYDVGERTNFALMPMAIAALEQVLDWQPARVQEYCAALTADLFDRVRALGYTVEAPEFRGAHLFGLRAPAGTDISAVGERLRERKLVAGGSACASRRTSTTTRATSRPSSTPSVHSGVRPHSGRGQTSYGARDAV